MGGLGSWPLLAAAAAVCLGSGCSTWATTPSRSAATWRCCNARPVDDWLADPATPAALKARLAAGAAHPRLRGHRPGPARQRQLPPLRRPAAPRRGVERGGRAAELSLTLKTWCFPVMGCVGYRGYFDRGRGPAEAAQLRAAGAGGQRLRRAGLQHAGLDELGRRRPAAQHLHPLPRGRAGALIFHELAHQVVYVDDDTMFNESFATAVERQWAGAPHCAGWLGAFKDRIEGEIVKNLDTLLAKSGGATKVAAAKPAAKSAGKKKT
jgi:predicted aminopeptidase